MTGVNPADVQQVAIFDGLSDDELKQIAAAGTQVNLPANWSLIWDKTPADKAYIILDGEVAVHKHGHDEVARLGPGNIVGETAIINHKLRSGTVVTLTPVSVLHFTREAVEKLCADVPKFRQALEVAAEGRIGDTASS